MGARGVRGGGVVSGWLAGLFPTLDPRAVVREHGPQVYRDLKRIFGPRADVDDTYQNVFVEVLRSLPSFQGRARLRAWIRRITWNVAYQEMRAGYRAPTLSSFAEDAPELATSDDAELAADERHALARLYAALERLDAKLRVVVVLHDVEGRTLKEIGEALGRPLQTVASQLRTGRARLVEAMQPAAASPAVRSSEQEVEG